METFVVVLMLHCRKLQGAAAGPYNRLTMGSRVRFCVDDQSVLTWTEEINRCRDLKERTKHLTPESRVGFCKLVQQQSSKENVEQLPQAQMK